MATTTDRQRRPHRASGGRRTPSPNVCPACWMTAAAARRANIGGDALPPCLPRLRYARAPPTPRTTATPGRLQGHASKQ